MDRLGHQVMITTPDRDWERIGFLVNEGPAVLNRMGKYLSLTLPQLLIIIIVWVF